MAFTTLPENTWTSVATISVDTVFQNRSGRSIFVTTAPTSGLALDAGILLGPREAVQIQGGNTVSASCVNGPGLIFHVGV